MNERVVSKLRPYQVEGAAFLRTRSFALLADEMGLGKTVQAAVALQALAEQGLLNRGIVVAPGFLLSNWQRELRAWAPRIPTLKAQGSAEDRRFQYRLPVKVLLVSYDHVRLDNLARLSNPFDVVVLDEAQRIKNADSLTALACRAIPRSRSWALTGTPVENRSGDLVAIYQFLQPGLLHDGDTVGGLRKGVTGSFLRRTKAEVLKDLPPILTQTLYLEMESVQRAAYQAAWLDAIGAMKYPTSMTDLFAVITKLKQLCNFDPQSNLSAKLTALLLLIDSLSAPADKVLVFSQYVKTIEWLEARIPLPVGVLHGGMTGQERDYAIEHFSRSSGPRALLVSLKAGGVGLNLQSASHVVLFDRWWNPSVEDQAVHRAHRFGREVPLHVLQFVTRDSVEERIESILGVKRGLVQDLVEDVPGPAEAGLSRAELEEAIIRGGGE